MHKSNIHLLWVVGVLMSLLTGTLAVKWNGIPDLPGLISFAVGLASLILAVIAIFQTLTSTGNVEAALAAVRATAEDSAKAGQSLLESVELVSKVAEEARDAAGRASDASTEFSNRVATVISSNEVNIAEISRIRQEIEISRKELSKPKETGEINSTTQAEIFPNGLTLGGATASYAAIRAYQSKRAFSFTDFSGEFGSTTFYDAYLAALDDTGVLSYNRNTEGKFEIEVVDPRLIGYLDARKQKKFFTTETREKSIRQRITAIDAFFATEQN